MTNDVKLELPAESGIYKIYRRDPVSNERIYVGTAEVGFENVPSAHKKKQLKQSERAKAIDLSARRQLL